MAKFKITGDLEDSKNRPNIIKYGRSVAYPILPEELEVIPRDEWILDDLGNVNMEALHHPHKAKVSQWDIDNFRKKHDYLLLMQCTNAKPYCSASVARMYSRFRDYLDFGSLAFGVEPWALSNLYPGRWLEWDHMQEDHYMHFQYCEQTIQGILDFQEKHKYKKVFVFCQHYYPCDPVTWMLEDNTGDCRDWLVLLSTPEYRARVKRENKQLVRGLYIMRMPTLVSSRRLVANALCDEIDDEDEQKKIRALVEDPDQATSTNTFDRDIAKKAYADGYWPDDPEWLDKYEKENNEGDEEE